MPHTAKTLAELKAKVEDLATTKLKECIEVLLKLLAHKADAKRMLLQQKGRYNANEALFRKGFVDKPVETLYNQILDTILDLVDELTEADFAHLEKQRSEQEKMAELVEKVKTLDSRNDYLSSENKELFLKLENLKKIEHLYEQAKTAAKTAKEALQAKEKELIALKKEANSTFLAEKEKLQADLDNALHTLALLQKEKEALQKERDALQAKVTELSQELTALRPKPLTFTLPEMVFIKGGEFMMGEEGKENAKPHLVGLDDFYIGKYPVTVEEFAVFIQKSGYKTDADTGGGSNIWNGKEWVLTAGVNWECDVRGEKRLKSENRHPVIHVSWNDAMAYCEWLSKETGKKYTLPSEAQWEYAARGGQNFKYAGSDDIEKVAWYSENSDGTTKPVGGLQKNGYGLYDMSGNVWEWCWDYYDEKYYEKSPKNNPTNNEKSNYRILRGGSWYLNDGYCRVSFRYYDSSIIRNFYYGFRLVC